MPPIIDVKESFKVAVDNGNQVIEIEPGEHEVDDRIADVAVNQLGVAEMVQKNTLPGPEPEPEPAPTKSKPRTKGKANDTVPNTGTSEVKSAD